jgi:hypothetical protein
MGLRVEPYLLPDASKDGFAGYFFYKFDTNVSGTHADIGGVFVKTPLLGSAGGATVNNITTLKVDAAPVAIGGSTVRALWVSTGQSDIDGNLAVKGRLHLGATTVTSGVGNGDIALPNGTGSLMFANAAGTAGLKALTTDSSNRLLFGEDYSEVQLSATFMSFSEVTEPGAGATNTVRLYAKDTGGSKTTLCARFATGAAQCFATEP